MSWIIQWNLFVFTKIAFVFCLTAWVFSRVVFRWRRLTKRQMNRQIRRVSSKVEPFDKNPNSYVMFVIEVRFTMQNSSMSLSCSQNLLKYQSAWKSKVKGLPFRMEMNDIMIKFEAKLVRSVVSFSLLRQESTYLSAKRH